MEGGFFLNSCPAPREGHSIGSSTLSIQEEVIQLEVSGRGQSLCSFLVTAHSQEDVSSGLV